MVTSSDIIRVSGSTKIPIFTQKSFLGIQTHKYCWIDRLTSCSRSKAKEISIAVANAKVLNNAHRRRKPTVAFGKKNANDPVKQEATSGHKGIIQAYSFESFTNVSNPNSIYFYFLSSSLEEEV